MTLKFEFYKTFSRILMIFFSRTTKQGHLKIFFKITSKCRHFRKITSRTFKRTPRPQSEVL